MTGGCAHREKGIYNTAACEFSVHPNQIRLWRNHLMEQLPNLISTRRPQQEKAREELEAELFLQIGQLKMEIEWLKKDYRRSSHDETGQGRKRDGGDIYCPTFYYQPEDENPYNLALMRLIDKQFTKRPFYGVSGWRRAFGRWARESWPERGSEGSSLWSRERKN